MSLKECRPLEDFFFFFFSSSRTSGDPDRHSPARRLLAGNLDVQGRTEDKTRSIDPSRRHPLKRDRCQDTSAFMPVAAGRVS